jgi:hypothetical protein
LQEKWSNLPLEVNLCNYIESAFTAYITVARAVISFTVELLKFNCEIFDRVVGFKTFDSDFGFICNALLMMIIMY